MLIHPKLYNPIAVPEKLDIIPFSKYVETHENQTGPTDPSLVGEIKDRFYEAHSYAKPGNLDRLWELIGPKVEENTGLAEFIKDYRGTESKFFFPWLENIFTSSATALEISYGAGPDIDGKWIKDIHKTEDPIARFVLHDPAFVYNRERQIRVADLAMTISDRCRANKKSCKIVDFGAGRMPWLLRHGCKLGKNVKIYAFDKDEAIKPEEITNQIGNSLTIRYSHGDFVEQLSNPEFDDADLIILGGVASYIEPDIFYGKIIPAISMLLKPGGVVFFDIQTDTPCYRHSMDILGWQTFALPKDPSTVVATVEEAKKKLWKNGIRFSSGYAVDTYNEIPSAVMVTLTKC